MDWSGVSRTLETHAKAVAAPTASMAEAAVCSLIAIAMVHIDNRLTSIIIMMIFATGVAASVFLIFSHDRPFIGRISVGPEALLQVMPQPEAAHPQTN